jgi:hypothetical protein
VLGGEVGVAEALGRDLGGLQKAGGLAGKAQVATLLAGESRELPGEFGLEGRELDARAAEEAREEASFVLGEHCDEVGRRHLGVARRAGLGFGGGERLAHLGRDLLQVHGSSLRGWHPQSLYPNPGSERAHSRSGAS